MEATIATLREPISLRQPRKLAVQELSNQLKIGLAIANQRIRDRWALDQARSEKQEWVSRVSASLSNLFSSARVCERFNDWPAKILPEYAELDAFITMFGQEMKHRIGRLQGIVNHLPDVPELLTDSELAESAEPHNPASSSLTDPAQSDAGISSASGALELAEMPRPQPSQVTASGPFAQAASSPSMPGAAGATSPVDEIDVDQPMATLVDDDDPLPIAIDPSDEDAQPDSHAAPKSQPTEAPMILTSRPAAIIAPPASPAHHSEPAGSATVAETTILLLAGAPEPPAVSPLRQFLEKMGLKLDLVHCPPGGVIHGLEGRSPQIQFALILLEGPASRPEGDQLIDLGQRLFDLGYCVGKVGAGAVCAIHDSGQCHVDPLGITHLAMDRSDGWQLQLGRLLRKAGVPIDLNRLV